MPAELKDFVVNLKSLSQDIEDPIIQGGGDANGRTLRIIFTQEAAASVSLAKLGSDVGTVAVQSSEPSDTKVKLWIQI